MPVIPEVVHVIKAARIHTESFMQNYVSLIVLEFFVEIRIRFAVPGTVDHELVQMAVRPPERRLKYAVKFGQLDGLGHEETPPYRRNHVEQLDFELPGPGDVALD